MDQIIRNVIMFYPKVQEPAPKFDPSQGDEYSVQIAVTKAEMQRLKKMNINKTFKSVDDDNLAEKYPGTEGMYMVRIATNAIGTNGKSQKPTVFSANGEVLDCLIGNGSKGDVKINLYESKKGAQGKLNAQLMALRITELVEYKGKKSGDITDGFDFSGEMKKVKEDVTSPF